MAKIRRIAAFGKRSYAQRIKSLFGSSLIGYYPLDETSGTTAADKSGNNRNGTYIATPTLSNLLAPSGKLAPLFNGSTQYVNLTTSGLQAAINLQEFSINYWMKTDGAGRWDSASNVGMFAALVNGSNSFNVFHQGVAAKSLRSTYVAGGVTAGGNNGLYYPSAWVHISLSASKIANEFSLYYNGALVGTYTPVGTWAGVPSSLFFGAITGATFNGWLSDLVVTSRPITQAENYILTSSAPSQRIKRISYVGDSITANSTTTWVDMVSSEYLNGAVASMNHAIAGNSIIGNMDTQAALCANDKAHTIYVALGTNDDNAGNMTTLRAIYEAGLDTMQASNPGAIIKLINVWPLWEADKTTPRDKSNIRAMIDAIGTARGLTVLQPFSEAWYTGAETVDGTHTNSAGDALITDQIIAGLP